MKKIIALCLIGVMAFSFAACSSNETPQEAEAQSEQDTSGTLFVETLNDYYALRDNAEDNEGRTVVISGWINEISDLYNDDYECPRHHVFK